jgi:hypothetical protein
MPDRVVVFLDWQNVYRGAREAFCRPQAPHWEGQVAPRGSCCASATRRHDVPDGQRRVWDSNPRGRVNALVVFKTTAIGH